LFGLISPFLRAKEERETRRFLEEWKIGQIALHKIQAKEINALREELALSQGLELQVKPAGADSASGVSTGVSAQGHFSKPRVQTGTKHILGQRPQQQQQ